MQLINEQDFNQVLKKDKYYKDRWGYISEVINFVKDIKAERVLEIGPYKLPIFKDSETLDIVKDYPGLTYQQDAMATPYQFKDKEFDLLVAMQSLEHLHPKQKEVFAEWRRIAKVVVISLPYMWYCPDDVMHHNIDIPLIEKWTGLKPDKLEIKSCRIILKYE